MGKDLKLNLKDGLTKLYYWINWCAYKYCPVVVAVPVPYIPRTTNSLIQQCIGFWVNYFQIWHCCQCHWITVSSIGCKPGEVKVYNSLYSDLDETAKCKLKRVFGFSKITVHFPSVQQQTGVVDCGLFAIAFATSLALGQDVFEFQQQKIWFHLKICFE